MIVSCGDSFFAGTDLDDPHDVWPAQIAHAMGVGYYCYAHPGVGNLRILQQILQAVDCHGQNAIYAVNWSWIDRFDYVGQDDTWHTTRPSVEDSYLDPLYYRHFHSELVDKFRSLTYINQAIEILQGHRFIMTCMDDLLLDQQWHAPDYIRMLQDRARPSIQNFDGKNFLQWSRDQNFPESNHWHPLKPAHSAAAKHWLEKFQTL